MGGRGCRGVDGFVGGGLEGAAGEGLGRLISGGDQGDVNEEEGAAA
jgi:hypothetical protein